MSNYIEQISETILHIKKTDLKVINNFSYQINFSSAEYYFLSEKRMFEIFFKQLQLVLGDSVLKYYKDYVKLYKIEPFEITRERSLCRNTLLNLESISKTRKGIINFVNSKEKKQSNIPSTLFIQIMYRDIIYLNIFNRSMDFSNYFFKDNLTFLFLSNVVLTLLKSNKLSYNQYIGELYNINSDVYNNLKNIVYVETFMYSDMEEITQSAEESIKILCGKSQKPFNKDYFGIVASLLKKST